MYCGKCGSKISDNFEACPYCGAPTAKQIPQDYRPAVQKDNSVGKDKSLLGSKLFMAVLGLSLLAYISVFIPVLTIGDSYKTFYGSIFDFATLNGINELSPPEGLMQIITLTSFAFVIIMLVSLANYISGLVKLFKSPSKNYKKSISVMKRAMVQLFTVQVAAVAIIDLSTSMSLSSGSGAALKFPIFYALFCVITFAALKLLLDLKKGKLDLTKGG